MIKTLYRQAGLLGMLVFILSQAYAANTQLNSLLLPVAPEDTLAAKAIANNNTGPSATIRLQAAVQNFVDDYLDENAAMLENIRLQNKAAFKTIQKIFAKQGIPDGLLYLAVVESKLKNSATSGAGAAGIWQLMPETARALGLKVNGKTDQRRHLHRSSEAAAAYLHDLYKQYDDWLLVVAAYNCGTGNVNKAIRLSGSREFWKMQRFLPAETRNHVKRFIATHFYYEEKGSIATLTKNERISYFAALNEVVVTSTEPAAAGAPVADDKLTDCVLTNQPAGEIKRELKN